MPRISSITKIGAEQRLLELAASGTPHTEIARQLSAEFNTKIDRHDVDRWIRSNTAQVTALRAASDREKADTLGFTVESVRKFLGDVYQELKDREADFEKRPSDLAKWYRLRLQSLDTLGRATGLFAPDSVTAIQLNVPGPSAERCAECPYRERFTKGELKRLLTEGPSVDLKAREEDYWRDRGGRPTDGF